MPTHKFLRRAVIALTAIVSTKSIGANVKIGKRLFAEAGVPSTLVQRLLETGVLIDQSAWCYRVKESNLASLSASSRNASLQEFKLWLEQITEGGINIELCDAAVAKLGTNDFVK